MTCSSPRPQAGTTRWLGGWLLVGAALACGCGTTGVCPRSETLGTDAGTARCIVPVDCPRPSNVLVCSNTVDHYKGCVDCVATECVLFRPGPCP